MFGFVFGGSSEPIGSASRCVGRRRGHRSQSRGDGARRGTGSIGLSRRWSSIGIHHDNVDADFCFGADDYDAAGTNNAAGYDHDHDPADDAADPADNNAADPAAADVDHDVDYDVDHDADSVG